MHQQQSLFWIVSDLNVVSSKVNELCLYVVEAPFSVVCNDTLNSMEDLVLVVCFSSGGNIDTLNCTFDNSTQSTDCCKF